MKLTDTQLVVLSAALTREDGSILPLPVNLKGGAVAKVCSALLAKGLAEETGLPHETARTASEKVFRTVDEEQTTLLITPAGRQALNADAEPAPTAQSPAAARLDRAQENTSQPREEARRASEPVAAVAETTLAANAAGTDGSSGTRELHGRGKLKPKRAESKQAKLIAALKEPAGASIAEIATAFGWQAHTVRGAIAGALKKKLGLDIRSEAVEGRGRVYRIVG